MFSVYTAFFFNLTMRLQILSEMSNTGPDRLVNLLKRKCMTSTQNHATEETKHTKGNWAQVV